MSALSLLSFIANHPLNRGRKMEALLRAIRWQLASRLVSGDVVHEWINGSKFLVRCGETGLTGNIYVGLQEFSDMAFLLHMLRPDDLFVDVGANVGSYTILACAAVGARGCSIEPVPATFHRLVENVRLNHLESSVDCFNVGISSAPGNLRFSSDMDVGNRALVKDEQRAGDIEVPATTLDALLAGRSPRLIKIDVEGYESAALAGAGTTLRNPDLHAVIMEVNGSGEKYGFVESKLFEVMDGFGFAAFSYVPAERELVEASRPGAVPTDNKIFVRNVEVVRELLREARSFSVNGKRF
ncbi:FkbM family methyltransferase [soil metagenome]